jgi:hypothetical protein
MTSHGTEGHVYIHEDVVVRATRTAAYLANQGSWWSFSEEYRYDLVGIFGQLRPAGRWPRAVNLWEADWHRIEHVFDEQFGTPATQAPVDERHNDWWRRSAGDRSGGWDRLMVPGPGSRALAELQEGTPRPCVVQQVIALRHGAQQDFLAWVGERVPAAVDGSGWELLMSLRALHGSTATVLYGAPTWDGVGQLAGLLPVPDPDWRPEVTTSLLQAWEGSALLQRGAA